MTEEDLRQHFCAFPWGPAAGRYAPLRGLGRISSFSLQQQAQGGVLLPRDVAVWAVPLQGQLHRHKR